MLLNIETKFGETRKTKKRLFYELCEDEHITISDEAKFIAIIIEVVDRILLQFRNRFEALKNLNDIFPCLNEFQKISKEKL